MGPMLRSRQGSRAGMLCMVLGLGLLAACASVPPLPQSAPTRLYEGPPRPSEQVAVIMHSRHEYVVAGYSVGGWRAELESVDGAEVDPARVEVLPGRYTVGMGGKICVADVCSGTVPAKLAFTAVAGHAYRVDCDYWLSEMTIHDTTEDRVVARVVCDDGQCAAAL